MEKIQVPPSPARLLQAVSSIGYDPEVALCDLMDNSVGAGAKEIMVWLEQEVDTEGEADGIHRYLIADDGAGMDRDGLISAFTLGTNRDYPKGALGKFGMGLKSAGLSLGDRITLVSKTKKTPLLAAILSKREVEDSKDYTISLGEPPPDSTELWQKHLGQSESGTLLIVSELAASSPPYSRFKEYLERYCGNIYHMFMTEDGLKISVNGKQLRPVDPLFETEAIEHGALSPEDWDGKSVKDLLGNSKLSLDEYHGISCSIRATHLIHPPSFESEGKQKRIEMRDHYQIEIDPYTKRPRHGFFIYRNRRIIVMAERFHGLISNQTQAMAFRARLMFNESADSVLALDVKKRHCQLPKNARNNLKAMIANYQTKSVNAWIAAGKKHEDWKGETKENAANQSVAAAPVSKLDYAPGEDLTDPTVSEKRKEKHNKIAGETQGAVHDPKITLDVIEGKAKLDDLVIPVQGLKANAMWLPYPAVSVGKAETLINKAHSWVAEALAQADKDPRLMILLYQLFTILARADLEVRSTPWPDLNDGVADKVLERFRKKASAIGEDMAESLSLHLQSAAAESENE